MKIKYFLFITICMITLNSVNAQKVKFKKDKVLLDGKEVFKFDKKALGSEISIYTLDGNDEILYMTASNNGTQNYIDDDYVTLNFFDQKIKFESQRVGFNWKKVLTKLFKEQVIKEDLSIDTNKLEKFASKYSRY